MYRTTLVLAGVAMCLVAVSTAGAAGLDCQKPIKRAQSALDKLTDDLKGMESMPQDQLAQIGTLRDQAKTYLDGARHDCGQPQADFDRAQAIAKAEAAHGYATAADMLHFQLMKGTAGMSGMQGTGGSKTMSSSGQGTGSMNAGGMKGMPGGK